MVITDIFPYFNEKELLELRINLLQDYVDMFIICDANRTHSGLVKEFTAKKTINELGLPSDKILVVEVDLSKYDDNRHPLINWSREREQRNQAVKYIQDDAICFVSDCDEIIDPTFIDYYVSVAYSNSNCICRLPMTNLCSRADLQVCDENLQTKPWNSGFVCLKKHLEEYSLSQIRESYTLGNAIKYPNIWVTDNNIVNAVGWHFSWMGNSDRIIKKYQSFMHCDDYIENAIYARSSQSIENFMELYVPKEGSTDPLGRTNHLLIPYPIEKLPKKLFELSRVKSFLLPVTLQSIIEENPYLPTDKNTLCFKKHPKRWTYPGNYCHSYFENFYENEFVKYRHKPVKFCEIGIDTGASFFIWNKYFQENSSILGIDINNYRLDINYEEGNFNNVSYIFKDAYDPKFVNILSNFDIIIDDGPHSIESQINFIKLYLPKLNIGGTLIIEDVSNIEFIDVLKEAVPEEYKSNIEVVDLIKTDDRYDSLIFVIRK